MFPEAEYRGRLARAQAEMRRRGLSALLVTTETDIFYFTGFLTRFWASPSRPWFVILPVDGDPIAVIPEIGAALMGRGWVSDIRTWPAPRPEDDGVTLLAAALAEQGGPVGTPDGPESHLRMPLADFARLKEASTHAIGSDGGIVAALRAIKSPAEIDCLRAVCALTNRAFDRVGEIAGEGVPLPRVFRAFQSLLLEEGADWVGFLAGAAGPDGYEDVISPANDRPLASGDVLMLDTGAVLGGYYSDFDRNYAVGEPSDCAVRAHRTLIDATRAGFDAARPGARACDVWQAMTAVTGRQKARFGHGLGLHLTEGLSFLETDESVLQQGMVLTLEPYVTTREGRIMVHEEVITLTEEGALPLTRFAEAELAVL